MNRAVASFLAFCVALVILFGSVAWWLGGPLLNLAFDTQARQAPYHVLYLANSRNSDNTAYQQGFKDILAQESVQLMWRAGQVSVPSGEVADEWQQVAAVRFTTGQGFVRLVTSGSYRQLQDQAPGGRSVFGLTSAPQMANLAPELLMIAASSRPDQSLNLLQAFAPAMAVGGRVVWDSPMVVLEGESEFDRLLVLSFADAALVDEWLWSTSTETDLALLRSQVRKLTLWRLGALSR